MNFQHWLTAFGGNLDDLIADPEKIAAVVVAVVGVSKWLLEYSKKNRLDRFSKYEEMRKRTDEGDLSTAMNKVDECGRGATDQELTDGEIEAFTEFYEEVALMRASGLVSPRVAYYMFGYFIIRSATAQNFTTKYAALRETYGDRDFWQVFEHFRQEMIDFHAGHRSRLLSRLKWWRLWGWSMHF